MDGISWWWMVFISKLNWRKTQGHRWVVAAGIGILKAIPMAAGCHAGADPVLHRADAAHAADPARLDRQDHSLGQRDPADSSWRLVLLLIPLLGGAIGIIQRRLNAMVGEGVIYDLRVALYARLQRMSLHFFTNTKLGELMSRLNNDVVGAQNAISNTIVNIITNIIQAVAVLVVMLTLEWRLTLISIVILPLFILAARRMGVKLRDISRQQMEANAQMNATMNETLNIGGALLVKLFGRAVTEVKRFENRAAIGA